MKTKKETNTAKFFRDCLDSFLWELKKTDIQEAQLNCFLEAFEIWLKARSLNAVVIAACFGSTSSFSRLIHLLTSDKRGFIENLANDIELWFFSHYADVTTKWPNFFQFTPQIASTLESDRSLIEYRTKYANFRDQYLSWDMESKHLTEYERRLSNIITDHNEMIAYFSTKYHENMIIAKGPLAPSKQNLMARTSPHWKCQKIGKILKHIEAEERTFSPYFMKFDLYPSELIESIDLSHRQKKDKLPFWIALCSENLPKANFELVLSNYRRRIGA